MHALNAACISPCSMFRVYNDVTEQEFGGIDCKHDFVCCQNAPLSAESFEISQDTC